MRLKVIKTLNSVLSTILRISKTGLLEQLIESDLIRIDLYPLRLEQYTYT